MSKAGNLALALSVAVLALAGAPRAQTPDPLTSHDLSLPGAPFSASNEILTASLDRIFRGSPLWRDAADAVRKAGRRAHIVTPNDRTILGKAGAQGFAALEQGVLAEVVPVVRRDSTVPLVIVLVNLALLQDIHDARRSVRRDFEADLDRILVHEVYGHAVPYLLAGNLSGRCADPAENERATEACSIQRENAVRAQLGLGRRADHGVHSLALALGHR